MCAIFGIAGDTEASHFTYLGLHALQHRGQQGVGIVSASEDGPTVIKRSGLVTEAITTKHLNRLKGSAAIGHTRYSTTGGDTRAELQPLFMKSSLGWLAIAHNGNLVNAQALTHSLEHKGAIFQSTSDTEVILHLLARSAQRDAKAALAYALKQVQGAYSILVLSQTSLIAVRDPFGFRPLVMGKKDGKPVFASESNAFDLIGATYEREIEPGEMVYVDLKTLYTESSFPFEEKPEPKRCVFEHVYFARPDSLVFGERVHEMRKLLGEQLAKEQPPEDAEVIIPVPDSGVPAAIGYSNASKVPFDIGIIRSHYIGRTFIQPQQSIRNLGVKLKLSPVKTCVEGKSVVIVDDSLVRGTTSKQLISNLREAGAKKVHVRISAPPTTHSCFYGIDTPTRKELLASNQSVDQIRNYIGADSLGYLSLEGLIETTSRSKNTGFCHACFSGEYATAVPG